MHTASGPRRRSRIAALLVAALAGAGLAVGVPTVARADIHVEDGIHYSYVPGDAASGTVTAYEGPVDALVPPSFEVDGVTYQVTQIAGLAFGDYGLTSVSLPSTLASIGPGAFRNNSLIGLTLPAGLTSIGEAAFYGSGIRGILRIPDSVTTIGEQAFADNALAELVLGTGLDSIGDRAFASSSNASDWTVRFTGAAAPVTIQANDGAEGSFGGDLVVPVPGIRYPAGASGFSSPTWKGYDAEAYVTFEPNGGTGTAYRQSATATAPLDPAAFTRDARFFAGWSTTPGGAVAYDDGEDFPFTTIGAFTPALYAQWSTTGCEVHEGIEYCGDTADVAAGATVTGYLGPPGVAVAIPDTVELAGETFPVAVIGDSAFRDELLTALELPGSITRIGQNAFQGNALTEVTVPPSVVTIGSGAFAGNPLVEAVIGGGVTGIGSGAFATHGDPFDVRFEGSTAPSISPVGASATFGVPTGVTIYYPVGAAFTISSGKWLGYDALPYATVTFHAGDGTGETRTQWAVPHSVSGDFTPLDPNPFLWAGHFFQHWTYPDGGFLDGGLYDFEADLDLTAQWTTRFTETVGDFVFRGDTATGEAELVDYLGTGGHIEVPAEVALHPEGSPAAYAVTRIGPDGQGSDAFRGKHVTSVELPEGLRTLGQEAFADNELEAIELPATLAGIEHGAFRANGLTELVVPEGVTAIWGGAFSDNELASIDLPDTLITIDGGAFAGNELTSVAIPARVASIGPRAFDENPLTEAAFLGLTAPTIEPGDDDTSPGIGSFGPQGGKTLYYPAAATGFGHPTWQGYAAHPIATVTFDPNGGEGEPYTQTAREATALEPNAFERAGHVLAAWTSLPGGGGSWYAPGAVYPFVTDETLYAQWELADHAVLVSPSANGTATASPDTGVHLGDTVTLTVTPDAHHHLDGWTVVAGPAGFDAADIAATGAPDEYEFAMPDGDVTLRPAFAIDVFDVTFDADGGAPVPATQRVAYGGEAAAPDEPSKAGHAFLGWFTAPVGGDSWDFGADAVEGPRTLYAQWEEILPGTAPAFADPISGIGSFTVQVTNHDPASRYRVQSTAGLAVIDGSGRVTVSGLPDGGSATVTVTVERFARTDASGVATGAAKLQGASATDPVTGAAVDLLLAGTSCTIDAFAIAPPPSGSGLPTGVLSFELGDCGAAGVSVPVELRFSGLDPAVEYAAYKGAPTNRLAGATSSWDGSVLVVAYSIVDGGPLDDDHAADGVIVDPVGLVVVAAAGTASGLAGTGLDPAGPFWLALLLLALGAALTVRRQGVGSRS